MIVKFNLTLLNPTTENWLVWKGLESEITKIMTQQECVEIEREYDEVNFRKEVTIQYESDRNLCKLLSKAGRLAGKNGLEVDMTDRVKMSSPSLDLINNHKEKYKERL